jgi:hypothetical protein
MRLLRRRQQQLALYGRQDFGNPTAHTIAGFQEDTSELPIPEHIGLRLVTSTGTEDGGCTRGIGRTEATLISTMVMIMAVDNTGTD